MIRLSILTLVAALHLAVTSLAQAPDPTATVHLKILLPANADDLGVAKVTLFKSESTGQDYAKQFRDNTAPNIPFGIYQLEAYTDGFASAEREVVVYQSEVWVVMGLKIGGIDYDQRRFKLSGTVRHLPSTVQPVWVRLTGVHSTLVMDAKLDVNGNFVMAGLPEDKCVVIVWSGTRILDTRPLDIPKHQPLVIDLAQGKGQR